MLVVANKYILDVQMFQFLLVPPRVLPIPEEYAIESLDNFFITAIPTTLHLTGCHIHQSRRLDYAAYLSTNHLAKFQLIIVWGRRDAIGGPRRRY